MKKTTGLMMLLMAAGMILYGQQEQKSQKWDKINWLLGAWKGEGLGKPGQGGGTFAFSLDLNGQIMVRHGHTEFPASQGKTASVHDDMMIFYSDPATGDPRSVYFDNEGHTILYSVSQVDKSVVLTSEKVGNMPAFRITYTLLENGEMDTVFDMAQDGKTFVTYLEGKSRRAR
jgi:hypothetical protein